MRSVFLVLLLANLVVFAAQFQSVQDFVFGAKAASAPTQVNAERLRIIRDTSASPRPSPTPAS